MGEERLCVTDRVVTPEERAAVAERLQSLGGKWVDTPDYGKRNLGESLQYLEDVYKTLTETTNANPTDLFNAYEASRNFYYLGFKRSQSTGTNILGRDIKGAFVVPMRSSRFDDENGLKNSNASEITPFAPILDRRLGVGSKERMRAVYGLPPMVLDTYFKDPEHSRVLVVAPIFGDMKRDMWPDRNDMTQARRLHEAVQNATHETVKFVYHQLGGRAFGLGAILPHPTITNYGNNLRGIKGMEDIVTTTGHAGTVHMIVETIGKVREETSIDTNGTIGVIGGAGSIGWSSTATILAVMKDHKVISYDRNEEKLLDQVYGYNQSDRIELASDVLEVLESANVIVSAVTTPIDLDKLEKERNVKIDLSGKVIIDDSQPGCFSKDQVDARGGHLIWVIGEDASQTKFMSRDGANTGGKPYNYGDTSGVLGEYDDFPCGQELATLEYFGAFDRAIRGPVTPESALAMSGLMRAAGVRPAQFQSYGQAVHIA